MKPVALSRGRGISLINDLSQLIYGDQVVIQEYIAAPRLLNGYKFDLRLYVLVTSFNPLEALFTMKDFSIQKKNENFTTDSANVKEVKQTWQNEGDFTAADSGGTKLSLAYLWKRLAAEGVDVVEVKRNIDEVVLKALICGEDEIPFQVNSFDLFGYDILLDSDLRPWLIEINSSPSMARENDLDMQIKNALMLDALGIVDPLHFDRAKLAEVIARRQHDEEDEKKRPHVYTRHPRETEELAARQLNEDLTAILRGKLPRAYGEMPQHLGKFRRLCPYTNMYNQLVKFKRSYTRKV
ncbi:putative tubulin-tyrosine ligase/Tubulin polyglutamylase [Plasmopara halstedii]